MSKPLARLTDNLLKFPARTLRSARRRLNPVYRFERRARREIPRRFGSQRVKELDAVPGTSSRGECQLLALLALQSPPGGVVLEIGAFKGKSTAWLVEAAEHRAERPTVVSIDPHIGADWHPQATWPDFQRTVETFGLLDRRLEIRRAFSADVARDWQRPISFLWVDGSHAYEDVVADIEGFVPFVVPGGYIVFDDATDPKFGVRDALRDRMRPREDCQLLGLVRHLAVYRRTAAPAKRAA